MQVSGKETVWDNHTQLSWQRSQHNRSCNMWSTGYIIKPTHHTWSQHFCEDRKLFQISFVARFTDTTGRYHYKNNFYQYIKKLFNRKNMYMASGKDFWYQWTHRFLHPYIIWALIWSDITHNPYDSASNPLPTWIWWGWEWLQVIDI